MNKSLSVLFISVGKMFKECHRKPEIQPDDHRDFQARAGRSIST